MRFPSQLILCLAQGSAEYVVVCACAHHQIIHEAVLDNTCGSPG